MKKILVLGATGAMGKPLMEKLSQNEDNLLFATSRKKQTDGKIKWICCNAHDMDSLQEILKTDYDAIVDFMVYTVAEFKERYKLFLEKTRQYIFISSARVYAPSDSIIKEESPRILDICNDKDYIRRESYDIAKAMQEDMLIQSGCKNYTILRPSLTYNDNRLQLALYEKDEWLSRVLLNKSLVFPKEMEGVNTTMTWGDDVATLICEIILNPETYSEIFNVTCGMAMTWGEIWRVYSEIIENETGIKSKVFSEIRGEEVASHLNRYYQYIYARGIDRVVSNEKILKAVGEIHFISMEDGLRQCLHNCLKEQSGRTNFNFRQEGYLDKITNEWTHLSEFDSWKHKLGYFLCRIGMNI